MTTAVDYTKRAETMRRVVRRPGRRGVTLIECTILLIVFALIAVGAGVGLQSLSRAPTQVETRMWTESQLAGKIESLRDTAYASLTSGSGTSDADFNNVTYTITWTVTEIDPSKPTSVPPVALAGSGLKLVTVTMNGQSISTWISQ